MKNASHEIISRFHTNQERSYTLINLKTGQQILCKVKGKDQRDRQIDRQIDRQKERQINRQIDVISKQNNKCTSCENGKRCNIHTVGLSEDKRAEEEKKRHREKGKHVREEIYKGKINVLFFIYSFLFRDQI